jgi:hypothetical protein
MSTTSSRLAAITHVLLLFVFFVSFVVQSLIVLTADGREQG